MPFTIPRWADPVRGDTHGPRQPRLHLGRHGRPGLLGRIHRRIDLGQKRAEGIRGRQSDLRHQFVAAGDRQIGDDRPAPAAKGRRSSAYDRETGDKIFAEGEWKTSYSSPILTTVAGVPQILNFTRSGLLSHDPRTGKVLWQHQFGNDQGINASQPLLVPGRDDQIFLSTGYGVGSDVDQRQTDRRQMASQDRSGPASGWRPNSRPPLSIGDYVYGLDNGIFACISLKTGELVWKKGRYGHGQILQVGDLILVQAEKGHVVLVQPDPEKLIELGEIPALVQQDLEHARLRTRQTHRPQRSGSRLL